MPQGPAAQQHDAKHDQQAQPAPVALFATTRPAVAYILSKLYPCVDIRTGVDAVCQRVLRQATIKLGDPLLFLKMKRMKVGAQDPPTEDSSGQISKGILLKSREVTGLYLRLCAESVKRDSASFPFESECFAES